MGHYTVCLVHVLGLYMAILREVSNKEIYYWRLLLNMCCVEPEIRRFSHETLIFI